MSERQTIPAWVRDVIAGTGGMNDYETYELVVWNIPEREAAAQWVIRCLANPNCKGSGEVLQAIIDHRKRREA